MLIASDTTLPIVPVNPSRPETPTNDDGADLRAAVDVVGDRWVLLLVNALAGGPRRFGDLSRDLHGVAPNVLTDRLRRVERAGLITGTAYQHRPRRLVYALTSAGEELATILPALASWSARRAGSPVPRHSRCGAPLEMRWWCPECATEAVPDEPDVWL